MDYSNKICPYCGKNFFGYKFYGYCGNNYGMRGYIDHCFNFSEQKHFGDVEHNIKDICYKGNEMREDTDIMERLNCYLQWNDIPDDIKNEVKKRCQHAIEKIQSAKKLAKEIISDKTMLERKFIILAAQNNLKTPYGNEDNKFWK